METAALCVPEAEHTAVGWFPVMAQIDAVMAKFPAMLKTPGSSAIRKLLQKASQARDGRIAKLLGKRTGK